MKKYNFFKILKFFTLKLKIRYSFALIGVTIYKDRFGYCQNP
jgi:hypothetical protein